jgi:hypothetical protein
LHESTELHTQKYIDVPKTKQKNGTEKHAGERHSTLSVSKEILELSELQYCFYNWQDTVLCASSISQAVAMR